MRQLPRVFILLISLMALFSIGPSASAHVSLVSTSPGENSTVDQLPARVVIEFNEPLIIIGAENPNSLKVTSQTGASATSGDIQVSGSTISIALNEAITEIGDFAVSYRVVSSDGHEVSGSYTFTLAGEATVLTSPVPIQALEEGQNGGKSLPIYGILGSLVGLAIGVWALYRARFAHRK